MTNSRYTAAAVAGMLGIILIQGFHVFEHVTQVIQRYVLEIPKGAGVLGTWLDVEPVHLGYNAVFLLLVVLVYWQGDFWQNRRRLPLAFGCMTFGLAFQSYHFTEHLFKIVQFAETGKNGTPGILGHHVNLVWLHFWFNSIVYAAMLGAFISGGFLQGIWAEITHWLASRANDRKAYEMD